MNRGGTFLVSTAVLAVAACGGSSGKLEIRPTPSPLAQGQRPVPFRIAEARGQLALGNVALALEAFRKAWRDDPNSIDALAGMAACYDQMGRFDLSRRNYEAALALAPADPKLLGAFAASLDLQGQRSEALKVRQEIAARAAARALPRPAQQVATAPAPRLTVPLPAPRVAAATVRQPVPAPVQPVPVTNAKPAATAAGRSAPVSQVAAHPVTTDPAAPAVAFTRAVPVTDVTRLERPTAEPLQVSLASPAPPERLEVEVPAVAPVTVAELPERPARTAAVTVELPAGRPAVERPVKPTPLAATRPAAPEAAVPVKIATPKPADTIVEPTVVTQVTAATSAGPRLERLSMGEIALVTAPGPVWQPTVAARTARSTTVSWMPLREASASSLPSRVRILNAARVNRLAARTRSWLVARGWSPMGIGNADAARLRSVIVYPKSQRALAQNLANQFGFAMEERADAKFVTMVLGRDASRIGALRPRNA